MIPNVNVDTILSDPLLLVGVLLVGFGVIGFLFALIKFLRADAHRDAFEIPDSEATPDAFEPAEVPAVAHPVEDPAAPEPIIPEPPVPPAVEPPQPRVEAATNAVSEPEPPPTPRDTAPPSGAVSENAEKTVVIPPAFVEIQGQIEIAISQIRNLGRKMSELEQQIDQIQRHQSVRLEGNELTEGPANPKDFAQKLLKLAEHVIVLEKEVARLKGGAAPRATETPRQPNPPMPL